MTPEEYPHFRVGGVSLEDERYTDLAVYLYDNGGFRWSFASDDGQPLLLGRLRKSQGSTHIRSHVTTILESIADAYQSPKSCHEHIGGDYGNTLDVIEVADLRGVLDGSLESCLTYLGDPHPLIQNIAKWRLSEGLL